VRLVVPVFVGPHRWDSPGGLIRRDPRLGFISRRGLERLFLPGGLAEREPGSRRLGSIEEAARHPADVAEQLAAFLPERLGVSLDLVQSRLRLIPQCREFFL
jgi:hypothetical protein